MNEAATIPVTAHIEDRAGLRISDVSQPFLISFKGHWPSYVDITWRNPLPALTVERNAKYVSHLFISAHGQKVFIKEMCGGGRIEL